MGISIDEDPGAKNKISNFARDYKVRYTLLWDDKNVADAYNVQSIPNAFIIDKEGNIIQHHMGFSEDEFDLMSNEIEGLLK